MIGLLSLFLALLTAPFKSKIRLEAENVVLRHQLLVLRRNVRHRIRLTNSDRWIFVHFYRWFPSILNVLTIVQPETLVRWHRAGFCCYWRWKSRRRGGRPQIETEDSRWGLARNTSLILNSCQLCNEFGLRRQMSQRLRELVLAPVRVV